MYVLDTARKEIIQALKQAFGKSYTPSVDDLEIPRVKDLGDFAFPCFGLAKGMKRAPNEIAAEFAGKIAPSGLIKSIEANGPYINFYLDPIKMAGELNIIFSSTDRYGHSDILSGKKIMVEYAQPNTHKSVHVGHVRNALVGQGVVNILNANGANVIPTSYINDLGLHVAKCLYGVQKFFADEEPQPHKRTEFLAEAYKKAHAWLEENPDDKKDVQHIFQALEEGKRDWGALWKKTKGWSMDYIKSVFEDLGLTIDQWYFESDLVNESQRIVDDLLEKGIAQMSEGAAIVDFDDELPVYLLRRTDGTLLYYAKDLALAHQKERDHKLDQSLYIIDVRQSLAMQQLFATLDRMGFKKNLKHIPYEILTLPDGAMSSRKGNIVSFDALKELLVSATRKETKTRHENWDDKKVEDTAEAIAFAAMKFSILNHDLDKVIVFDSKKAIAFEGATGPYCLYTLARIESVFKKAESSQKKLAKKADVLKLINEPEEVALAKKIAEFPDLVRRVGSTYQISAISVYAFELAKTFSEFYHKHSVLQAESDEIAGMRLWLMDKTKTTLTNALALLGIQPITEM